MSQWPEDPWASEDDRSQPRETSVPVRRSPSQSSSNVPLRSSYPDDSAQEDNPFDDAASTYPHRDPTEHPFASIDWIADTAASRRKRISHTGTPSTMRQRAIMALAASSSWLVIVLTGAAAGVSAGIIDICSEWLSDLRLGYCRGAFYLSQQFCCWKLTANAPCQDWIAWGGDQEAGGFRALWGYLTYILSAIIMAGISATLIQHYALFASGSGIPEIRTFLAGFEIPGFFTIRDLLIKTQSLILAVGSGLSVGKEGPLVHIACSCGDVASRIFSKFRDNPVKRREVVSAAAAAGISVAFGAPIGGVLFSLEELSYFFPFKTMWRAFVCAMSAAVALQFMNPYRTGKLVLFQVTYDRDWHWFDMAFFVLLGVLGGCFGAFFNRMALAVASMRQAGVTAAQSARAFHFGSGSRGKAIKETVAIATITAVVSYVNIFMRVDTTELVSYLFRECEGGDFQGLCAREAFASTAGLLVLAALAKTFLTLLALGVQVPAGVYMPTMAIGACAGRALGMLVQAWQTNNPDGWIFSYCPSDRQCITPGIYALVGAAAAMGGVTRLTVSLVVMVFELTGALTYVLPIMIAVMVSKWVGDQLGPLGGHTSALLLAGGYPILSHDLAARAPEEDEPVTNIVTHAPNLFLVTASGHTLGSLQELIDATTVRGYPVVEAPDPRRSRSLPPLLYGYVLRISLEKALGKARSKPGVHSDTPVYFSSQLARDLQVSAYLDLSSIMEVTPTILSSNFTVSGVADVFSKLGVRYVLFTKHGRLNGLLTRKDLLGYLGLGQKR